MEIREIERADVPELIELWVEVFGDRRSYAESFFAALPDVGSGVAALCSGKIVGAAYTLNGQELVENGRTTALGYLYGVGVYEEYRGRGIGGELIKAVYALSGKRGASIVCILPAEESLYDWYEELLGMKHLLRRKRVLCKADAAEQVMPLSVTEYALWRENYLRNKPHVRLSSFSLALEERLCAEYGGGFFMSESGIAAAYMDEDAVIVREVLSADDAASLRVAASVGAALGAKDCLVCLPSESGYNYILSDRPLPADCVWNLSFD